MDTYTGGSKESFFCSSCGSLQDVNVNYVSEWTLGQNIVKITVNKFAELLYAFRNHWTISSQSKWANKEISWIPKCPTSG